MAAAKIKLIQQEPSAKFSRRGLRAPAAGPRIDRLTPNTPVIVRTQGTDDHEHALFVRIDGVKEDRVARFAQATPDGELYEWDAYRNGKRWAYTDSKGVVRVLELVEIHTNPYVVSEDPA